MRRPNLRIYGVPLGKNETASVVETKVKDIISNVLGDVEPSIRIDRAHRVSKVKVGENGTRTQPIIVRFPTFKERTLVYNARKQIKARFKLGVSLDLTKARLNLLNTARDYVKDIEAILFVYSDINCYLRVLTKEKKHVMFTSHADLLSVVAAL